MGREIMHGHVWDGHVAPTSESRPPHDTARGSRRARTAILVVEALLDSTGDAPGFGTLFGLAIAPGGHAVDFVDDGTNTLNRLS
jgi:hypothetical protein